MPLEDGKIKFPIQMNLSSEKLDRQGLYLLENGLEMFLWVGKSLDPTLCQMIFGRPLPEAIVPGKVSFVKRNSLWYNLCRHDYLYLIIH